jgi:hypothetical protein
MPRIRFSTLFWLTCNFASAHALRILMVGDSVDRYAVHDWCLTKNGSFCKTHTENGWIWIPTNCTTIGSYPDPLYDLFKQSVRVYSWGVSVCDVLSENISLGFLFNMQGVSPNPPWFDPRKSHLGLETFIESKDMKTVDVVFRKCQGPAIAPLIRALGGHPDAIVIQSLLWDISRLITGTLGRNGGVAICNSSSLRDEWSSSWLRNASELVDTVSSYFPNTHLKAWRGANQILDPDPPCKRTFINEVNERAKILAKQKQIPFLDFSSYPGVSANMRDLIHPSPAVNVLYVNDVVRMFQKLKSESQRSNGV